ncbi:DUF2783 domain-containing protein [Xanthobacter autotrophicus]|nr:DUF2783 domain-containing protein [Xanthobacter autotrophicus]MDI4665661.1 DUF2783 domain-containing protein [Xanthobacter autotrophicus]
MKYSHARILLLANHIGDRAVLTQALQEAGGGSR